MASDFPPMSPFALAFAAEYRGFMRANGVSRSQIAARLERGEGYVSERINGKRALDTNDVDALASLVAGWDGISLMLELTRRAEAQRPIRGELVEGRFGVSGAVQDEPDMKQPPKDVLPTAARRGRRKADEAPHAN